MVDEYLKRLRYKGDKEADLKLLKTLHQNHLLNIPFENLNVTYQIPIQLSLKDTFNKVIKKSRGGFCYELNLLFFELLKELGYCVKIISTRVFSNDGTWGKEYDHLAIILSLDKEEYLVDVGFGEFFLEPLKLVNGIIQHDKRGDFVIEDYDSNYFIVNKIDTGTYKPQYLFSLKPRKLEDFINMCEYHQKDPHSPFTHKRLISISTADGRITITDNILKINKGEKVSEVKIVDEEMFYNLLHKHFNYLEEVRL